MYIKNLPLGRDVLATGTPTDLPSGFWLQGFILETCSHWHAWMYAFSLAHLPSLLSPHLKLYFSLSFSLYNIHTQVISDSHLAHLGPNLAHFEYTLQFAFTKLFSPVSRYIFISYSLPKRMQVSVSRTFFISFRPNINDPS